MRDYRVFVLIYYIIICIGCASRNENDKKYLNKQISLSWKTIEEDLHPEIYGMGLSGNGIIVTSGGTKIFQRIIGKKPDTIYSNNKIKIIDSWQDNDDCVWSIGSGFVLENKRIGLIIKCKEGICEESKLVENWSPIAIHGTSSGKIYLSGIKQKSKGYEGIVASIEENRLRIECKLPNYRLEDIWVDKDEESVVAVGYRTSSEVASGIILSGTPDAGWKKIKIKSEKYIYISVWGESSKTYTLLVG